MVSLFIYGVITIMQKSNHNKSRGFYQGIYQIKRPQKYIGGKPPVYRSNWEAQ